MIKILANTDLGEKLTPTDFERVLDWFRSNGIDPEHVPANREVVIYNDAMRAKVDCWLRGVSGLPAGAKTIAIEGIDDLLHVEVPILAPLPVDLVELLMDIWKARIEEGARAAAEFATAEYRAKAGL